MRAFCLPTEEGVKFYVQLAAEIEEHASKKDEGMQNIFPLRGFWGGCRLLSTGKQS